jgi:3-hydroxyisobutyrate dehydrogenase-like beta-hydroxyacid dehydrogenase
MAVVGFNGLGLMGAGFTKRLAAAGHDVIGFDVAAERVEAARAWGVKPASAPEELARKADIICICVTTTAAVEEVVFGPSGIVAAGRLDGKVVVDFSTTEIASAERIARDLPARTGASFLDAPVSGGPGAAEGGTLAIMVGGEAAAFELARPVLEAVGTATLMGPTPAGQATKLVNQALVLTNYCVAAEAFRLAQAFGVDVRKVPEALKPGYAYSALLPVLFERFADNDFAPRGYARQVLKDLEMLQEAARDQHLAMPMAGLATSLFRILIAQGKSELDGAAVVTLIPEPEKHPAPGGAS